MSRCRWCQEEKLLDGDGYCSIFCRVEAGSPTVAPRPLTHYRSGVGTAFCGQPAKQSHLRDGRGEVDCPHCLKKFRGGRS